MSKIVSTDYKRTYEKIQKDYKMYRNKQILYISVWVISFIGIFILSEVADAFQLKNNPYINGVLFMWVIAWIIFTYFLFFILLRKYTLPLNERAFSHTYRAIENLEDFIEKPRWKIYRKKAVRELSNLSYLISLWNTGNLMFVRNLIGKEVKEFKKSFQQKILPIVKKGNENELNKLISFLYELLEFWKKYRNSAPEDFLKVYDIINEFPKESYKKKIFENVYAYFSKDPLKYIAVSIGCILIGVIIYAIGVWALQIEKGTSYVAATSAIFLSFGAYLNSQRKKST